jgi:hypothetical protein
MPSKEEIFKSRFAAIMADVEDDLGHPEGPALLGSLADRIVVQAKQPDWTSFKANLSFADCRALLTTFQKHAEALTKQGAMSRVHAIDVLAYSLIAYSQSQDVEIADDDKRLNRLIDGAIRQHRSAPTADPTKS